MQKFRELSNFGNAKTFPNIKAHTNMPNYKVVEVDQINQITSWATAATKAKDLCVVMQYLDSPTGDLYWQDRTLTQGTPLLCLCLESLADRFIDVGASHITGGVDGSGALTVAKGDVLVPDGTGNWVVGSAPATGVYLLVTGITTLPTSTIATDNTPPFMVEPAVTAQIVAI